MGESMMETIMSKNIKRSIIYYALIACAATIITTIIGSNIFSEAPLISQFYQVIQSIMQKVTGILRSSPTSILPFITLAIIALKLKKKINDVEMMSKTTTSYYQPKKNVKVENPTQQRVKIVASAPARYFSELIKRVYTETTEVYGNIPLWVRYNWNTLNHSWSLNDVRASHNIHVYGENAYVKAFLTRMSEELKTLQKNASKNVVNIHSVEPETILLKIGEKSHEGQLYPKEIKTTMKKWDHTGLLSGLGLFAVALMTLFAVNNWKRRHAECSNCSTVGDEQALQVALKTIRELGVDNKELKEKKVLDDGWTFQFADYEIFVNRQGIVTYVRRNA